MDTKQALRRYEELSPSFSETRECKLVKEIITCLEEKNGPDRFTEAVKDYDKISRLDGWHTEVLVKVKKHCEEDDEEDLT